MEAADRERLKAAARAVVGDFACSDVVTAGVVAAALITEAGHVFTGICIDTSSSLGFCAEHAAIAEMLKARETRIKAIVAVYEDGTVLPPCGRCRELIRQVDPANWDTEVIVSDDQIVTLGSLLPFSAPSMRPAGTLE
jgi:cytidine deaminase